MGTSRLSVGSIFLIHKPTFAQRNLTMSASHRRTDIHRRQQRLKKRNKLRARIAATPPAGRAALEARVLRTYSAFHTAQKEKQPPTVA